MNNSLRVALSTVDMAPFLKQWVQFAMVVDFAVERDPHGTVFIRHGLMAANEVYDGKTPMPKTHSVANPGAGIIRPTMHESITHPDHLVSGHALVQPYWINDTASRTHEFTCLAISLHCSHTEPIAWFNSYLLKTSPGHRSPHAQHGLK